MYDIYVAEAMIENDYTTFDAPEKKEAFIQQVFHKHGVSEAQWDTSLSWYSDHIDIYLKMNDSVKARLLREQKKIERLMAQQYSRDEEKHKKNQSPFHIPKIYIFDFMGSGAGFSFRLDTAEISKRIDQNNFDFRFDVIGIPPQNLPKLTSMLILEYRDTVIYKTTPIRSNQRYSLSGTKYIPNDTLHQLTGFIHLQNKMNLFHGIQLYNIALEMKSNMQIESQPPSNLGSTKKQTLPHDTIRK